MSKSPSPTEYIGGIVADQSSKMAATINEPRSEKTGLRGFRPGLTQTGLYNHTRWPGA